MKIRFIGHMCHVTSPQVLAVMFAVPHHEVRLRVEERYTTYGPGDPEFKDDPDWVHCRTIANSIVSFASTGTSATTHDTTGLIPVPSLSRLGGATATLHADVRTPNPRGAFNVFVRLPFGAYGIEDWFDDKATFNGGISYMCIPRTITFTAPSTAVWTLTGVPNPPTLTANAIVTITNLEVMTVPGTHFDWHGRLFHPPIVPPRPVQLPTNPVPCSEYSPDPDIPLCEDQGQQDLSVECSNTGYP